MPANYAHYRFGKQAIKTMPAPERQCVQRFRRLFDAGLHGPDIFFYYNPYWKTPVRELGSTFHRMSGKEFFAVATKGASSEAARAYLYGLLGHYCLDAHCHPFINQLAAAGEAAHVPFESEFDRFLLVRDGKEDPAHYDTGKKLKLTRGECMTVAEFYPGTTGGQISRSIRGMAFSTRFLSGGNAARRKAFLDKVLPGLSGYMIPETENEELSLYVGELKALYDAAREAYPRMLARLQEYMESGTELGADFEKDFG